VYRVGILSPSDQSSPYRDAFIDGMRTIGYQEGRDYVIESRFAEGKLDRLPTLAAELVELKVDVIVLGSIPAALATKSATGRQATGYLIISSTARYRTDAGTVRRSVLLFQDLLGLGGLVPYTTALYAILFSIPE
jgi:hypothetical protein